MGLWFNQKLPIALFNCIFHQKINNQLFPHWSRIRFKYFFYWHSLCSFDISIPICFNVVAHIQDFKELVLNNFGFHLIFILMPKSGTHLLFWVTHFTSECWMAISYATCFWENFNEIFMVTWFEFGLKLCVQFTVFTLWNLINSRYVCTMDRDLRLFPRNK